MIHLACSNKNKHFALFWVRIVLLLIALVTVLISVLFFKYIQLTLKQYFQFR